MSNQLLISQYRVYDANGFPIPGGLLYTYAPGTTTPRTVYTDSALSVAASNPVVADASGTFPPLYSTQPVKINVTDASGNAVPGYPRDHAVSGVDSDDFRVEAATISGALSAGTATVGGSAVYTKANILATVSYAGSTNTGGIFESGGTDIDGGLWTKFADGTMVLRIRGTMSNPSATQALPFPTAFFNTDFCPVAIAMSPNPRFITFNGATTTGINFDCWSDTGTRITGTPVYFTISGRWRA